MFHHWNYPRSQHGPRSLHHNLIKKVQKPYPETAHFPCDPNGPGKRSDTVPMSAHAVRPGDIDIVAAIGDSLTAGNGMWYLDANDFCHVDC